MGNIVFHCPKCDQKIKAPDIMAGEVGDCPNCQAPVIIPGPESATAPKAQPPSRKYTIPSKTAPKARITEMGQKSSSMDKAVPAPPLREAELAEQGEKKTLLDSSPEIALKRPEAQAPPPSPPKSEPKPAPPPRAAAEPAKPTPKAEAPLPTEPRQAAGPVEVRAEESKPVPKPPARKPASRVTDGLTKQRKPAASASAPASVSGEQTVPKQAMSFSAQLPDLGLEDDFDWLSDNLDYDGNSKPAVLAWVPGVLSLLPGLGQAYNLHVKKAVVFGILFLAALGYAVFRPEKGSPAVLAILLLSMADAYGGGCGAGFFGGVGRSVVLAIRTLLGLTGLLLWTLLAVLFGDTLAARLGEGSSIVATLDMTGVGEAARSVNLWVALALILGAALLLFFLQGFGRKLLWARRRPTHFMFALRVALAALALTGLLAVLIGRGEATHAPGILASLFAFPIMVLRRMLELPQIVGNLFDKSWPALAPGFLTSATTALHAFGHSAASSFGRYAATYRFVMLGGLIGILPLFLRSMIRFSRDLPGYGDWWRMWAGLTKQRTQRMREQWQAFREERVAAWEKRQALSQSARNDIARLSATSEQRFARLESVVSRMAEHMGVPLPPPEEIVEPELPESTISSAEHKAKLKAGASKAAFLGKTAAASAGVWIGHGGKAALRGARALKARTAEGWARFREKRQEAALRKAELKATAEEAKATASKESESEKKQQEVSKPEPAMKPKPAPIKPEPVVKPAPAPEATKPEPVAKPAEPPKPTPVTPSEPAKPTPVAPKPTPTPSPIPAPVKPEPAIKKPEPVPPPAKPEPVAKPAPSPEPAKPEPAVKPAEPPKPTPVTPPEPAKPTPVAPKPVPFKLTPTAAKPTPVATAPSPAPAEQEKKPSAPIKLTASANEPGKSGVIKLKPVSKPGSDGVIKLG